VWGFQGKILRDDVSDEILKPVQSALDPVVKQDRLMTRLVTTCALNTEDKET
jgi:hypothetical protein